MSELFEVFMVLFFGISWPMNIVKSIRSKTAKGKSLIFLILIWVGYVFGILSKITSGHINYVIVFYFINIFMVSFDIVLFFINTRMDKKRVLANA